jgi:hypothetical protein
MPAVRVAGGVARVVLVQAEDHGVVFSLAQKAKRPTGEEYGY